MNGQLKRHARHRGRDRKMRHAWHGGVKPLAQQVMFGEPLRRRHLVKTLHGVMFKLPLGHMDPHPAVKVGGCRHGAFKQGQRAGFDPVGRQQAIDQAVETAVIALDKADGVAQAVKAARLVKHGLDPPGCFKDHTAGAIGGAEKDPQSQFSGSRSRRFEFGNRFRPFAIIERGDRRGSGNPVQQEKTEAETF